MRMVSESESLDSLRLNLNEQWIWKDETDTLELINNNPGLSTSTNTNVCKKAVRVITAEGWNDRYVGRHNTNLPATHFPSTRASGISPECNFVTLNDVKSVAKSISKLTHDSPIFSQFYFGSAQLDNFLMSVLHYFKAFFERKMLEETPQRMAVQRSCSEKKAIALIFLKEEEAKRLLAQSYAVLLLGLGLEENHHMHSGKKRNSAALKDRQLYENLYNFTTTVTWITFERRNMDMIECELGRLLRSPNFNPALRPKPVNEVYASDRLKNDHFIETVSPAEYRRLKPKRPAIKSIMNQRSPVMSTLIPTSIEAAKQCKNKQELDITMNSKHSFEFTNNVGIIGQSWLRFNAETLIPLADEESKQVETNDKYNMNEVKSSDNLCTEQNANAVKLDQC